MIRPTTFLLALALVACGDSVTGNDDPWEVMGTGNDVIDRPSHVERVRITGSYSGTYQNFVVECGQFEDDHWDLLVNVILGTDAESTQYEGTHLLEPGCDPFVIHYSEGVAWTITKVQ